MEKRFSDPVSMWAYVDQKMELGEKGPIGQWCSDVVFMVPQDGSRGVGHLHAKYSPDYCPLSPEQAVQQLKLELIPLARAAPRPQRNCQ